MLVCGPHTVGLAVPDAAGVTALLNRPRSPLHPATAAVVPALLLWLPGEVTDLKHRGLFRGLRGCAGPGAWLRPPGGDGRLAEGL